mmetsp:Transcript_19840/g.79115  ORF Transcript_19840/g.79115 Transcript_19840/m.79115 type:complete len:95 (+) Transcript_19840:2410-2694(+)
MLFSMYRVEFPKDYDITSSFVDFEGNVNFGKYCDLFVAQVFPDSPLSKVYALMQETGSQHTVVVDGGKVVGIISKKDLISFIDQSEDIPRKYFL